MASTIDYYYAATSPWTYLGASRFEEIARRHRARVNLVPIDLVGEVFPATGGLPLDQRPQARLAYRSIELNRWRHHLGVPLNLNPRFYPVNYEAAHLLLVAARESGQPVLPLAHAILRAVWAEERNIADRSILQAIANGVGLDGEALLLRAEDPAIAETYRRDTKRAITQRVFGTPTYVYKREPFWGQDRLDFLDRALARDYSPPDEWAGAWSI